MNMHIKSGLLLSCLATSLLGMLGEARADDAAAVAQQIRQDADRERALGRRLNHTNIEAILGYGLGLGSGGDPFGATFGVRAEHRLNSGVTLGGVVSYSGGSGDSSSTTTATGIRVPTSSSTLHLIRSGFEPGYTVLFGDESPLSARFYAGLGTGVVLGTASATSSSTTISGAFWAGGALHYDLDPFLLGADLQVLTLTAKLVGASTAFVPSLTAGVRF
jgi:hypothetical protein